MYLQIIFMMNYMKILPAKLRAWLSQRVDLGIPYLWSLDFLQQEGRREGHPGQC